MRSWKQNLDAWTLLTWFALVVAGLVALYSTTHGPAAEYLSQSVRDNFYRQLMWGSISVVGIGIILMLPVRVLRSLAYPVYGGTIVLLILCLFFGVEVHGTRAWLALGPFRLQVSEFAKVGTVLAVAQLLSERHTQATQNLGYALKAAGLIVAPALLIVLQNDMGTALVFFGLVPIMLFWAGLPLPVIALMISPAVAGYLEIGRASCRERV